MKLLCIDFPNIVIRHAARRRARTPDDSIGVVGAIRQILLTIRSEQPTHLLIARDGSRADNVRCRIDAEYKGHRPALDSSVKYQLGVADRAAQAIGWPILLHSNFEADDLIASACTSFDEKCVVLTGDCDLLALCSRRVEVDLLRPGGRVRVGPSECRDILGVFPSQVQDYKAICGDTSDGIPGIPGIGPKRARRILDRYESLERVYDLIDRRVDLAIPWQVAHLLIEHREQARTSWRLAHLHRTGPVELDGLRIPGEIPSRDALPALESMGLTALRSIVEEGLRAHSAGSYC